MSVAVLDKPPCTHREETPVRECCRYGQDDWVACSSSDPTISEARLYVKPEVLTFDADQIDRIISLRHPPLQGLSSASPH